MNTESVGHPNYAARISISKDTTYTAPSNGLVMALINQQDHNTAQLRINGYEYLNKPYLHKAPLFYDRGVLFYKRIDYA